LSFTLAILQETLSFIPYDSLLEEVQVVIIYCIAELTTDPHAVVALFLFQHSWYGVLMDAIHLHILTEDSAATTNQNSDC
jgi:hypothetical protein